MKKKIFLYFLFLQQFSPTPHVFARQRRERRENVPACSRIREVEKNFRRAKREVETRLPEISALQKKLTALVNAGLKYRDLAAFLLWYLEQLYEQRGSCSDPERCKRKLKELENEYLAAIRVLLSRVCALEAEVESLTKEKESLEKQLECYRTQNEELRQENAEMKNALRDVSKKVVELSRGARELTREVRELSLAIRILKEAAGEAILKTKEFSVELLSAAGVSEQCSTVGEGDGRISCENEFDTNAQTNEQSKHAEEKKLQSI